MDIALKTWLIDASLTNRLNNRAPGNRANNQEKKITPPTQRSKKGIFLDWIIKTEEFLCTMYIFKICTLLNLIFYYLVNNYTTTYNVYHFVCYIMLHQKKNVGSLINELKKNNLRQSFLPLT